MKSRLVENIKRSAATITKVEAILSDEHQASEGARDKATNDSIQVLREQINRVPFIGNDSEKLDCNFEIVEDAHFSEEFIEQFSNNFGSFLHYLETVALQLHHK